MKHPHINCPRCDQLVTAYQVGEVLIWYCLKCKFNYVQRFGQGINDITRVTPEQAARIKGEHDANK